MLLIDTTSTDITSSQMSITAIITGRPAAMRELGMLTFSRDYLTEVKLDTIPLLRCQSMFTERFADRIVASLHFLLVRPSRRYTRSD